MDASKRPALGRGLGHDLGMEIRPCRAEDVEVLETFICTGSSRHHKARYAAQEAGESTFLIAWRGDVPVGHVSLLVRSKYADVEARHPSLREINALGVPRAERRHGVATALMIEAERLAFEAGAAALGLACDENNPPALTLYRGLGFVRWSGGEVVDLWTSRADDGVETLHADRCRYYVKALTPTR